MRLDLIVPHYKEPWETCKYLFDSIALQRGIDMDAIKVIVVNDGDCLLDEGNFQNYPYKIEYLVKEHGGVSAARNYGLDHSDADYVMFCIRAPTIAKQKRIAFEYNSHCLTA